MIGFAGSLWWVFDLLAHPRFQYAVVLLVVSAGLLVVRRRAPASVALIVAVLNGAVVAPLFLSQPIDAVAGGPELTVVSFNVQIGNPDRAEVIRWVADLDADVVLLWETSQPWRDDFSAARHHFYQAEPLQIDTTIGGLILTKNPARVRLLDSGDRSSIEVIVPFGDGEVVIVGAHPFPPISGRRSAERDDHLSTVAQYAQQVDGPLIVAGDLNATPWSTALQPLNDVLTSSLDGFGWQATYPAGAGPLMVPIDHLFHNEYLTTVDRRVGPDLGSDHLPIIVTLALPDEP